ncbi:MAG: Mur ligase family protein [Bryobacteraceae bacterium]
MRRAWYRYPRVRFCYSLILSGLAFLWRRLMRRTTFIAVTGSVGKTTATECLAGVLSARFPTNATQHGDNGRGGVAATILRTRLQHRFTVIEVGTKKPGALKRAAWLIRPDVVVVLVVAGVHTDNFSTLEDIAREKSQLMSRLRPQGSAVLNGDDPRVAAMAARCRGKVLTFGRSPQFDVWASEVSSRWPGRLSFQVHRGAESRMVNTKLVGEHWITSALAALATALCCGMDLETAASALEQVEPSRGRMEPVLLPSGAQVLRDDVSTTLTSLAPALRVLERAGTRRVLVLHDAYDSGLAFSPRMRHLGQMAARSADLAVFFGERSRWLAKVALGAGMKPGSAHHFPDPWGAAEFLKSELREGDLVLLRSCHPRHAERIYFAQLGTVGCLKPVCHKVILCDNCPELRPGLEEAHLLPTPVRPFWEPL